MAACFLALPKIALDLLADGLQVVSKGTTLPGFMHCPKEAVSGANRVRVFLLADLQVIVFGGCDLHPPSAGRDHSGRLTCFGRPSDVSHLTSQTGLADPRVPGAEDGTKPLTKGTE